TIGSGNGLAEGQGRQGGSVLPAPVRQGAGAETISRTNLGAQVKCPGHPKRQRRPRSPRPISSRTKALAIPLVVPAKECRGPCHRAWGSKKKTPQSSPH